MERYCVQLSTDDLVFSAAHFITYQEGVCERLHGHNYRVMAEIEGPLDGNHYVLDFAALRKELREIVLALDHRVLLPAENPMIQLSANDQEVEACFSGRRWVFPRGDCVILPLPNTTAELLAQFIGRQLLEQFRASRIAAPTRTRITVEECRGQAASCQWSQT